MGAGQTYRWAVSYPDMVQRACPFCGSSKTSQHNVMFLEGVKSALTADAVFKDLYFPPEDEEFAVKHIPNAEHGPVV